MPAEDWWHPQVPGTFTTIPSMFQCFASEAADPPLKSINLYCKDHRVVSKDQCSMSCSASLPADPIHGLQDLNMRLVLQFSADHSPARTRSLDCRFSRTSNTPDSVPFYSNPCPQLTSTFQYHQCFLRTIDFFSSPSKPSCGRHENLFFLCP